MDIPKVPSGAIPYIAVAIGGVIAWRILSGGGSSEQPPQVVQTGYDPELVALGTQSALKTKEIESQQAIATKAMDTEVATRAMDNELVKYQSDLGYSIGREEINLASAEMFSKERMYGGDLAIRNAELSVNQNIGLSQIEAQRQVDIQTAQSQVELARIAGDAQVKAAKASKSKGISFGGFGLKF